MLPILNPNGKKRLLPFGCCSYVVWFKFKALHRSEFENVGVRVWGDFPL